jgi:hypothetical protein
MQSEWEAVAASLNYPGEKEMWQDLYPKQSLSQLAKKFNKGINNVRGRIDHFQIVKKSRGGANNVKTVIDRELIDDVTNLGIRRAAEKRGIKPQALYHRLYYKMGTTVKGLRAASAAVAQGTNPPTEAPLDVKEEIKE